MTMIAYQPFLLSDSTKNNKALPTTTPSVAIITRTKNRPLLLIRALASITNQTFANWHLYIVNDGGNFDILESISQSYRRIYPDQITLIHHPVSLGMEAASNAGLSRIKQKYFVIHDDDDTWHPCFLEKAIGFLEKSINDQFIGVVSDVSVIYEEIRDNSVVEIRREKWGWLKEKIDIADMIVENSYPPIAMVVRSDVIRELKGFNADLPVLGDWEFNIRLIALGNIGRLYKTLAYYHHRPSANQNYGNSVHAGSNLHAEYRIRLRNELVRRALTSNPGMLGIVHVIMSKLNQIERTLNENIKADLLNKLQHMHWDINNGKMLEVHNKLSQLNIDVNNGTTDHFVDQIKKILSVAPDLQTTCNLQPKISSPEGTNSFFDTSHKITNIAELFFYNHSDFVNVTYLAILGRPADPQGMRYYLGRLGMGFSKASIIDQIARSDEAKKSTHIAGLKDLMRRESKLRNPLRRFFRFL
jgi:glycosyltransferase involved in cell wall biosynthesis